MDPTLLAAITAIAPSAVPYLTAAVAVCAVLAMFIPPPTDAAPKWWKAVYGVVNTLAMNKGHAANVVKPQ